MNVHPEAPSGILFQPLWHLPHSFPFLSDHELVALLPALLSCMYRYVIPFCVIVVAFCLLLKVNPKRRRLWTFLPPASETRSLPAGPTDRADSPPKAPNVSQLRDPAKPTPAPPKGQRTPAYIINHNNSLRWSWMQRLTRSCGLAPVHSQSYDFVHHPEDAQRLFYGGERPRHAQPMPPADSNAWRAAAVTLSHIAAWDRLAHNDALAAADWGLVFEDDCNATAGLSHEAMQQLIPRALQEASAQGHGLVFLGLCYTECNKPKRTRPLPRGARYVWPCHGKCAHAYAVTKAAAATLWARLRAFRFANPCHGMHRAHCQRRQTWMSAGGKMCCRGNATRAAAEWVPDVRFGQDWGPDAWLRPFCVTHECGMVTTGAVPELGLFFQDRLSFGSLVWDNKHQKYMGGGERTAPPGHKP